MKSYLISASVAVAALALALGFFMAGFFVRGWVDEEREVVKAPTGNTPVPTTQASSSPTAAPTAVPTVEAAFSADDPSRGPQDAAVTIIEFSDFQCSFCKRHVDETQPLIFDTYGDRVRYVFRDFPIASIHPQAQKAGEAAQCAFDQGKFWEYHDTLFANQAALDVASLKAYAKELGLDESEFDACLDSGKYADEVQKDFDDARSYGVTGVPTFFINGQKLVGAKPFADFQKIIEEELAKAAPEATSAPSG